MSNHTVVIRLEDDQQTSQSGKAGAVKTDWYPVETWEQVKGKIAGIWHTVGQKYPSVDYLRQPKTVMLRVGIQVEGKGTFFQTSVDAKMRFQSIRVFPPEDDRFNFHKLEKKVRKELEGIISTRSSEIPNPDQILDDFAISNSLTEIRNSMATYQRTTTFLQSLDTGSYCSW